ncbi:helix-turn-helix domain-containing protein [Streptomyces sp. NBC_00984]|uniref:helix-turn-helix domain-containing protein n=1 Tax=Streptomyces sp. NBC_00984 TaxID=2903700 RepID=UPI0038659CEA|nr:helix-turn-helix domain-containing protein [Streptomyces sp. NBC_00984]
MRYADGGGLTAAGRLRRESVRLQAAELFEHGIKPLEVAQRLRVSRKSAYQWHQLWREGGVRLWLPVARADRGAVCPSAVWRSWPRIWSRARLRTAGWRTRCGPRQGCPQLQPDCCDSRLVQVFHLHSNQQRLTTQTECVPEPASRERSHGTQFHVLWG